MIKETKIYYDNADKTGVDESVAFKIKGGIYKDPTGKADPIIRFGETEIVEYTVCFSEGVKKELIELFGLETPTDIDDFETKL